jgi:hypothetical protein
LAPKDTARDLGVKLRGPFRREKDRFLRPLPGGAGRNSADIILALLLALILALARKILIKRGIRGFRPEAERTVSANSPSGELDVAGPVGPSSRVSAF